MNEVATHQRLAQNWKIGRRVLKREGGEGPRSFWLQPKIILHTHSYMSHASLLPCTCKKMSGEGNLKKNGEICTDLLFFVDAEPAVLPQHS